MAARAMLSVLAVVSKASKDRNDGSRWDALDVMSPAELCSPSSGPVANATLTQRLSIS
jgi:hypothetical protein